MTAAALALRGADRALPLPLTTAAGFVLVIAGWELLARTVLAGSYVLAPPSAIVARIVENHALYGRALAVTLRAAALGFLFGNLAAIVLAAFVSILPRTERVVQGLALVVFCLPLVATGPILRVLFGPGTGPQVTLAALGVYYTTFIPLVVGLRAVPAGWLDLVASYGRGRLPAFTPRAGPGVGPLPRGRTADRRAGRVSRRNGRRVHRRRPGHGRALDPDHALASTSTAPGRWPRSRRLSPSPATCSSARSGNCSRRARRRSSWPRRVPRNGTPRGGGSRRWASSS